MDRRGAPLLAARSPLLAARFRHGALVASNELLVCGAGAAAETESGVHVHGVVRVVRVRGVRLLHCELPCSGETARRAAPRARRAARCALCRAGISKQNRGNPLLTTHTLLRAVNLIPASKHTHKTRTPDHLDASNKSARIQAHSLLTSPPLGAVNLIPADECQRPTTKAMSRERVGTRRRAATRRATGPGAAGGRSDPVASSPSFCDQGTAGVECCGS